MKGQLKDVAFWAGVLGLIIVALIIYFLFFFGRI